MISIYLLTMFKCQSVKLNMRTHFVSFTGASFLTRGCHFAGPGSHIQVSLIKEWSSGHIGFHLTDCPWRPAVILDTVYRESRCTLHRPAKPLHTLFTARSGKRCVTWAQRKSAHLERESVQLLFLAVCEFLQAWCKVKLTSHVPVMCGWVKISWSVDHHDSRKMLCYHLWLLLKSAFFSKHARDKKKKNYFAVAVNLDDTLK